MRLLENPIVIEALYLNSNTRMSTVDRLVELAARNGVELSGVATFAAHVEAIKGVLIVDEPTDEPLPEDDDFRAAVALDDDADAVEIDRVDGSEEVNSKHKPLATLIRDMNNAQKVRFTLVGNAAARAILVRDPLKLVALAAIGAPSVSDSEAARIAVSKEVDEGVLKFIGNKREWLSNYELKRNLVFNPKTPQGTSMKFLSHMRLNDLRALARSKNVPIALRTAANNRLKKKSH